MSRVKLAILGLLLIGFVGCSKNNETAKQQPPAAAQPTEQTQTQAQPAEQPQAQPAPQSNASEVAPPPVKREANHRTPKQASKEKRVAPNVQVQNPASEQSPVAASNSRAPSSESPAAPKQYEPKYATIQNGAELKVRLQEQLDSSVNHTGDVFRAVLDHDLQVNGQVVAPRGSVVEGKLSHVERSGRVQGRATMSLQLTSLSIGNESYQLQTNIISAEAESTKNKDAAKVGIGAGLGAVIGAIAGGGKGAAIGAAVGGGAGGATVLATRGKEVHFDAEQIFTFVISRDMDVKIR
jgi:hypothetical protein